MRSANKNYELINAAENRGKKASASGRHSKFPLRNQESALASFKDFQRESMLQREARQQSIGSLDRLQLMKHSIALVSSDEE